MQTTSRSRTVTVFICGLMLVSMFFGAGNTILPPMLSVEAGENFWPAILGFLASGVLLPVAAIVAIAVSGRDLRQLANRGGVVFGTVFAVMVYLSIGAFYALPRTGAVSFDTALASNWDVDSVWPRLIFNSLFFGLGLVLCWNPFRVLDTLGRFLTPILVLLLGLLITLSIVNWQRVPGPGVNNAFTSGLLEGYLTMDSLGALAYGIVIVTALRLRGFNTRSQLVRGASTAAIVAGIFLAVIYVGLALVGQLVPGSRDYTAGAALLNDAARLTMGPIGQAVFALIINLACLTTAIGLINATGEFFHQLVPGLSYHAWASLFTVAAVLMASLGLETVMAIAAPVVAFLYPPAITLIALTILEYVLPVRRAFHNTLRIPLWTATVVSALLVVGWGSWLPLADAEIGWLLPTVIAALVGWALDRVRPNERSATRAGKKVTA